MALPHRRDSAVALRRWPHHRFPEICSANARRQSCNGCHEQRSSPTGCSLHVRRFLSRIRILRHGLSVVRCVSGVASRRIGSKIPCRRRLTALGIFLPAVSQPGTQLEILPRTTGRSFGVPRALCRLGRIPYAVSVRISIV